MSGKEERQSPGENPPSAEEEKPVRAERKISDKRTIVSTTRPGKGHWKKDSKYPNSEDGTKRLWGFRGALHNLLSSNASESSKRSNSTSDTRPPSIGTAGPSRTGSTH
jgi:hypothetical protein